MNLLINLAIILEKELELERQGYPRTRRYIGDVSQVADDRCYQRKIVPAAETGHKLGKGSREARPSILTRLFRLPRSRPHRAVKNPVRPGQKSPDVFGACPATRCE